MADEFELVEHSRLAYLKAFVVTLEYRTPHLHNDFEFCLVLDGAVNVRTGRGEYRCEKGDLLLFGPNQLHELQTAGRSSLLLSVQVSCRFCDGYYPLLKTIEFDDTVISAALGSEGLPLVRSLLLAAALHYFERAAGFELLCFSDVNRLFYELQSRLPCRFRSEQELSVDIDRVRRLRRIVEYIGAHYTQKLLLSDIARQENLSLYYLSHLFRESFGMSFQQVLNSLRLEKARRLIAGSDHTLLDICLECGYSDGRYLNRQFCSRYGCTPREYRKERRKPEGSEPPRPNAASAQQFWGDAESIELLKTLS